MVYISDASDVKSMCSTSHAFNGDLHAWNILLRLSLCGTCSKVLMLSVEKNVHGIHPMSPLRLACS